MASTLLRNTLKVLSWQLARAALQALWAIGLARLLGVEGYGTFAGLTGLATALGAFCGLGFGLLMLQAASRDPAALGTHWGRSLWRLFGSAALLAMVYLVLVDLWLPHQVKLLGLIAIVVSELAATPLTILASYAFQSQDRMGWAGGMYALAPVGNVAALLGCVLFQGTVELDTYLGWHISGAVGAAVVALFSVGFLLRPRWSPGRARGVEYKDAGGFLAMRVVDTGLGTIDKSAVLRLAGPEVAGHYTAAYRLAALIALPAVSLAVSSAPKLFRQAGDAISQRRFLRRLLGAGVLLGMLSVPLAWCLSWLVPSLFGRDFERAAELARSNLLFPALLGLASLGCTMLMACGRKAVRLALQLGALLILILVMWMLVPAWAGPGAIAALNITYAALVMGLWWVLWRPVGIDGETK